MLQEELDLREDAVPAKHPALGRLDAEVEVHVFEAGEHVEVLAGHACVGVGGHAEDALVLLLHPQVRLLPEDPQVLRVEVLRRVDHHLFFSEQRVHFVFEDRCQLHAQDQQELRKLLLVLALDPLQDGQVVRLLLLLEGGLHVDRLAQLELHRELFVQAALHGELRARPLDLLAEGRQDGAPEESDKRAFLLFGDVLAFLRDLDGLAEVLDGLERAWLHQVDVELLLRAGVLGLADVLLDLVHDNVGELVSQVFLHFDHHLLQLVVGQLRGVQVFLEGHQSRVRKGGRLLEVVPLHGLVEQSDAVKLALLLLLVFVRVRGFWRGEADFYVSERRPAADHYDDFRSLSVEDHFFRFEVQNVLLSDLAV